MICDYSTRKHYQKFVPSKNLRSYITSVARYRINVTTARVNKIFFSWRVDTSQRFEFWHFYVEVAQLAN